jgi:hypothetical protein
VIIKGRSVGSIKHWGRYLPEQGENEKAIEHEIRGTLAQDLKGALEEMRDLSFATKSQGNFMYHASFNPRADEKLTPVQWQIAIDRVEEKLGFKDHQRIVYEHVKEGRQHFHVLWSRVDPETITIRDMKNDRPKLRNIANELEREFGLTPTKAVRDHDDPRPYEEWEKKQDGRKRLDRAAMKTELTELWHATDSGKAFIAAVEERGYKVAQGDRRDFVILDHLGDAHSLARRLDGVKTAEVRIRFADVGRDGLPSVAEARNVQRNLNLGENGIFDRDAAARAWEDRLASAAIEAGREKDKQRRDERTRQGKEQRLAARDRGHGGMVSEQRAATSRFERNTLAAEAQREGKPSPAQSRSSREKAEEHAPTAPQAQKAQEHEAKEPRVAEIRQARAGDRTRQPHGAWRGRNSGGGWER